MCILARNGASRRRLLDTRWRATTLTLANSPGQPGAKTAGPAPARVARTAIHCERTLYVLQARQMAVTVWHGEVLVAWLGTVDRRGHGFGEVFKAAGRRIP